MIKAVIFDVDGTLVDSVDLHGRAWQETFREFGKDIPFQEIRMQIGKGGEQLMPVFLSKAELDNYENRKVPARSESIPTGAGPFSACVG
jgi:beta-phosphoglucomutase-like phosphatase (HAD superfamily)